MNEQTKETSKDKLNVDEALEFLNKEIKGKKDEINRLISEKYSNLKETMSQWYPSEETIGKVKHKVTETVASGQEKAREMATGVDTRVRENPWTSVGIAAAAGFLLGYVFESRKR
ncbi:MAG: DUF883 domain-containing protein [Candidatus Jettenia sp.]|nr:DUF883 domain-containing protein [Candidatus Jettenia sp.]UJS17021.1 MAG: DUF883 domain-containing protein [Candidatus Jettenia sp.]